MHPDAIDRVLRKYAKAIGLDRIQRTRCGPHLSRPPWRTAACSKTWQRAAGHREPSTTKLYDRRGYNPEKSASYFATY